MKDLFFVQKPISGLIWTYVTPGAVKRMVEHYLLQRSWWTTWSVAKQMLKLIQTLSEHPLEGQIKPKIGFLNKKQVFHSRFFGQLFKPEETFLRKSVYVLVDSRFFEEIHFPPA